MLTILAGWIHEQQQQVIAYVRTENGVLKEKLGKKRIKLNDDQRRRLAVTAKVLAASSWKKWARYSPPIPQKIALSQSVRTELLPTRS